MANTFNLFNCPKVAGIYKINFPNGKCYIGLSNNIPRRMKDNLFYILQFKNILME